MTTQFTLTGLKSLDIYGDMEKSKVIEGLSALAQETRLDIMRFLVRHGAEGISAGRIGAEFQLPSATLAFHLNSLSAAGLVTRQRDGRQKLYRANISAVHTLTAYLLENCCTETAREADTDAA
ncbi:MAG: ArsR/SmtB family transcription factor [Methyloligellaceae bacterium]